jgi:hypothetical protein
MRPAWLILLLRLNDIADDRQTHPVCGGGLTVLVAILRDASPGDARMRSEVS